MAVLRPDRGIDRVIVRNIVLTRMERRADAMTGKRRCRRSMVVSDGKISTREKVDPSPPNGFNLHRKQRVRVIHLQQVVNIEPVRRSQ
jgi:hypothetical protein